MKKFLLKLRAKAEGKLITLRSQLEAEGLPESDVAALETEVNEAIDEIREIDEKLENAEDDTDPEDGEKGTDDEPEDGEKDPEKDPEKVPAVRSNASALSAIQTALSTRSSGTTNKRKMDQRSAFANFVVGNISEPEARSLGITVNNGSVTVPVEVASEVISYAKEENLLRKYGSYVKTDSDVKYPVLVKAATAQGHKSERSNNEVPETDIEFDSIDLDPTEFDALATITKKLLKRTGVKIENIVIEELKKAYVRKESQYMFRGDEVDNLNPGSLANKAVPFYETAEVTVGTDGWSAVLQDQLTILAGTPKTAVIKNARWMVNRAAYNLLSRMTDTTGRKLLAKNSTGVFEYDGFPLDFTDDANVSSDDDSTPVFYFGDFKSFHIQEIKSGLELQKLVEKFAGTNKVGFQIYNLIDGQLIYSPLEPTMFRYEIGAEQPGA